MSSKQLSAGNQYSRYIKKQVPSCERGIILCSKRRMNKGEDKVSGKGKGGEDGERGREEEIVGRRGAYSRTEDLYYFQLVAVLKRTFPRPS